MIALVLIIGGLINLKAVLVLVIIALSITAFYPYLPFKKALDPLKYQLVSIVTKKETVQKVIAP